MRGDVTPHLARAPRSPRAGSYRRRRCSGCYPRYRREDRTSAAYGQDGSRAAYAQNAPKAQDAAHAGEAQDTRQAPGAERPAGVRVDVRLHFEQPDLRMVTSSDLVSVLQRRTLGPTRLMAVRKS